MNQTPLHDWHADAGARMVDFVGWHMPVQYSSIVPEHTAVREAAGLFDISHMGRLWFSGPDAVRFADRIVTNDVAGMKPGRIRYALVTNPQGGILDDVLVYRFDDACMLVVNASNRGKILQWIEDHRSGFDVQIDDRTISHGMIALQGPRSHEILTPQSAVDPGSLKYYTAIGTMVFGHAAIVSRTGYTGEDGFELIVPADKTLDVWTRLLDAGSQWGILPAGLGCRDTLRLEAAMPLYGHELDESIDPFTAGIAFGVKLNAADFIGRDALVEISGRTDRRIRVGLELAGRRIAREGAELFADDRSIGAVTSGTFSPTLEKSICMAYVEHNSATAAHSISIDIRGKRESATIVDLPFYRRA